MERIKQGGERWAVVGEDNKDGTVGCGFDGRGGT